MLIAALVTFTARCERPPESAVERPNARGTAATTSAAATETVGPRGWEFTDCASEGECPVMVVIPAGTFLMGSPATEPGRFDDEGQQRATVQRIAVGKYPVTRGQWAAFTAATRRPVAQAPCAYAMTEHPTWQNPGFPQPDDHPVP